MPDQVLFHDTMADFHRHSGRSFPWRDSTDLYEVLIGEVLLQRTRGENVAPVYREFLRRWPTLEKLASARISSIENVIRPLGLIQRAPTLRALGRALADVGRVPDDPDELLELPGIGPYGAHAVPVFALGRDLAVVDWVIARVLRRYFGLPAERRPNSDTDLWILAEELADLGDARSLWLGVLDFAADICTPTPKCDSCSLRHDCIRRVIRETEP